MNKIIITRMEDKILTATTNGSRIIQLNLDEEQSILGNIYIGKVKSIAKNIASAFIDLGNGQTAYYSLLENKSHLFAENPIPNPNELLDSGVSDTDSSGNSSKKSVTELSRRLRPGDEIIVQVSKDAIKTKDPVVTGCISFTGRFCVVTAGKCHIGFSSKISDELWKSQVRKMAEDEKNPDFGIIIRTNAYQVPIPDILNELRKLKTQYYKVLSEAQYRTCYSLLYKNAPSYINSLRDTYKDFIDEIVTDDSNLFQEIQTYLTSCQPEDISKVKFYEDYLLPLGKLYSIEKAIEEALQKRIWLKSGGYLVIEPTEAMTVIDVNSGKYTGKKPLRETIRKINLEAAVEVSYQIRLRNLSGIIMIDFIDMETQEDRKELMDTLKSFCSKDPVKTTVVDMTKLGLVEITRKKIRKPFREQIEKGDKKK